MTTVEEITCPHPAGGAAATLCEAFQKTAAMRPRGVALRTPGGAQEITWGTYAERVRAIAAGLVSLGVRRGDTIGIMLTNRPEFHLVDTAALHIGAIPFSIYNTSSADQISYVFSNAENTVVITEQSFLSNVTSAASGVEHVVVVDDASAKTGATMTLAELETAGARDFDFDAAWQAVTADDVATLIYTSGTTGPPKGVELTHRNLIAEMAAITPFIEATPEDRATSYLPSAHVADRVANHYFNLCRGVQVTSISDPKEILDALTDTRPTVWVAVPRVWQKLKSGIESKVAAADGVKAKLAYWAFDVGQEVAKRELSGADIGFGLDLQHKLAEKLVLAKLRHALGLDQCRWALSGAAAIPADTLIFFLGMGVPVYEVWGMSETTAAATTNAPGAVKIGSVGKVLPGTEARLADDGELLVRGPLLMRGYRQDPTKTAETIDEEGWLHTGDIADIDADGFITIVDRKKELLINEAGKNMSPTNIENAMKSASPLIAQVVAIGDAKPYVSALVVLDPDVLEAQRDALGLGDASTASAVHSTKVRAAVTEAIKQGNTRLSRVEQIKRFRILPQAWDPGGDEMTPTMKLKRKPIAQKYADEIAELYAADAGPDVINL